MTDSGCEDTMPTMAAVCKLPEESDASMRARLFTSLSQSFPHSQLYKALHGGENISLNGGENSDDDDDSLYGDPLSSSCFASLRMDRRDSDDDDDDLRSLGWLQSEDLLKNIGGEKLDKEDDDNEEQKENEDIKPDINLLQAAAGQQQPPHLPYHPQKHVNSKPPYSFSCLIFMAVEASPQKRLPVKDIYNWILKQFPYFQNAPTGWKNSVRHNLSLNKCFKKVEKDKGQSIGKGSLWCIDPAYRPNLLQALRKTPYHPYHQLQMTSTQPQNYLQYQSLPGGGRTMLPLTQRPVPNTVSPHLFPFLSRRLAQTSFDVDNEMKDVAQTLVALKSSYKKESPDNSPGEDIGPTWRHHKRSYSYNNPRRRPSSPVVVTGHPYDDHAYSSTRLLDDDVPSPSSSSSIDEEYDFGDADEECESDYNSDMEWDSDDKDEVDGDLPSSKKLKIDMGEDKDGSTSKHASNESEDDEQKKIQEGANALLNLAGFLMNHRNDSSTTNSPDIGVESKGKEQTGINEKRKRASKKSKEVGKKQLTNHKEGKVEKKRSVSKRKNAGSNMKYDNEEYSVVKPVKGTKNRTSGTGTAKSQKSSASKDTGKGSNAASKPKTLGKGNKALKKVHGDKRKLKLSKSLVPSKKSADATASNKGESAINAKALKKVVTKNSRPLGKKMPSKSTTVSASKKSKSSIENITKTASTNGDEITSSDNSETSNNHNLNNNNNEDKSSDASDKMATMNGRQLTNDQDTSSDEKKECGGSGLHKTQPRAPVVNGEILSPAGDAPVGTVHSPANAGDDVACKTKLPEHSPTAEMDGSPTCKEDSNTSTSSNSSSKINAANSVNAMPAASHKSPHFTRFSKKKAALS